MLTKTLENKITDPIIKSKLHIYMEDVNLLAQHE